MIREEENCVIFLPFPFCLLHDKVNEFQVFEKAMQSEEGIDDLQKLKIANCQLHYSDETNEDRMVTRDTDCNSIEEASLPVV